MSTIAPAIRIICLRIMEDVCSAATVIELMVAAQQQQPAFEHVTLSVIAAQGKPDALPCC